MWFSSVLLCFLDCWLSHFGKPSEQHRTRAGSQMSTYAWLCKLIFLLCLCFCFTLIFILSLIWKLTWNLLAFAFWLRAAALPWGGCITHILDFQYWSFSAVTREAQHMHAAFTRCFFSNFHENGRCCRMLWLSWSGNRPGMLANSTLDFCLFLQLLYNDGCHSIFIFSWWNFYFHCY